MVLEKWDIRENISTFYICVFSMITQPIWACDGPLERIFSPNSTGLHFGRMDATKDSKNDDWRVPLDMNDIQG